MGRAGGLDGGSLVDHVVVRLETREARGQLQTDAHAEGQHGEELHVSHGEVLTRDVGAVTELRQES